MKRLALSLASILAFAGYAACGDNGGNTNPPGGCNPACGTGKTCRDGKCVTVQGLDAGDDSGDADIIIPVNHDAGTVTPKVDAGEQTCAATTTKAQQLPLDIYLMLDKSGSMRIETVADGRTRWDAVTSAINSFFSASEAGTSVALGFFPIQTGSCDTSIGVSRALDSDCSPCGTCEYDDYLGGNVCSGGGLSTSCTTSKYASPSVDFAAMPGAAGSLSSSIASQKVIGSTPTSAALQGAINHCKTWAGSHSDHVTIALLATDGEPTECDTNLTNIDNIAKSGSTGTPKVLTFVIGVGSSLSNLDGIAAAGGTGSAYLVDTGSSHVNDDLIKALKAIKGAALGCSYTIPQPATGTPDYTKVNVQYTPGGTTTKQIIPQSASKAACPAGKDGWYYDNPANPKQILLCDSTCTTVKTDNTGSVDVLLGCQTIIN